jgi:hypothetical protein
MQVGYHAVINTENAHDIETPKRRGATDQPFGSAGRRKEIHPQHVTSSR